MPIPSTPLPILKLLDKFLSTIVTDETRKLVSIRKRRCCVFIKLMIQAIIQWRIWFGSRNLTRAIELGSWTGPRQPVGRERAAYRRPGSCRWRRSPRAQSWPGLHRGSVRAELSKLTWECPPGCEVRRVSLLGPGLSSGFPKPPADTERMFVVSPFLDAATVRAAGKWGGPKTRRTLVSTDLEFQRLLREDAKRIRRLRQSLQAAASRSSGGRSLSISRRRTAPPSKSPRAKKPRRKACTRSCCSPRKANAASSGLEAPTQLHADGKAATSRSWQSSRSTRKLPTASRHSSIPASAVTPVVTESKDDEDEQALRESPEGAERHDGLSANSSVTARFKLVAPSPPPISESANIRRGGGDGRRMENVAA